MQSVSLISLLKRKSYAFKVFGKLNQRSALHMFLFGAPVVGTFKMIILSC